MTGVITLDEHGVLRDGRYVVVLMASEVGGIRICGSGFSDLDEGAADHVATLLQEWVRNRRIAKAAAGAGEAA